MLNGTLNDIGGMFVPPRRIFSMHAMLHSSELLRFICQDLASLLDHIVIQQRTLCVRQCAGLGLQTGVQVGCYFTQFNDHWEIRHRSLLGVPKSISMQAKVFQMENDGMH